MIKIIVRVLIFSLAVFVASYFVNGVFVTGVVPALIAGALLSILHFIIKPVLQIITLPINLITFGLFALILNSIFFWFVSTLIPGLSVANFIAAFWGAVVVSVVNWIFDSMID